MMETGSGVVKQDRRLASRQVMEHLVEERTQLLVLFCRVAGVSASGNNRNGETSTEMLQELCELLVDYIAAGHFTLYERIINGQERRVDVYQLAEELYPDIAATTDRALGFNDKYENNTVVDRNGLDEDLSILGESLAQRIELEDRLLRAMFA